MFELGFWELVLVAVVALVVLGPERLPHALRTVGNWVRTVKQMASSAQQQVERELNLQQLREDLKKAEALGMHNLPEDLSQSVESLKQAAAEVTRPYASSDAEASSEAEPAVTTASKPAVAGPLMPPPTAPQRLVTPAPALADGEPQPPSEPRRG